MRTTRRTRISDAVAVAVTFQERLSEARRLVAMLSAALERVERDRLPDLDWARVADMQQLVERLEAAAGASNLPSLDAGRRRA